MATPVLRRSERISKSCNINMATPENEVAEKLRSKRQQFFSKGLSLSQFSKSFVTMTTRIAHLSPTSHSAPGSPVCDSPRTPRSTDTSTCSTPTSTSSSSSTLSSNGSIATSRRSHHHAKRPTCVVFGKRHGHSKRTKSSAGVDERRPVLLEKVPSGKSAEDYMTVYVGVKRTNRVKYVISKDLLSHHLFQVLLKCSEDEFGDGYATKGGFAIICDPALFLQVVKMVDENMRATELRNAEAEADDEGSSYESDEC